MSSTKESWLSGRVFSGRFEIGRLIAHGGMSEVYQGVDLWTQNAVAIKVMAPRYSDDPSKQQKFFRESNSLSRIQHRNIVSVVASSTEKVLDYNLMYIVLEYVHGCTLEQLLRVRRVLSIREMLDIMLPTVEGLSEVHAMHYIHRDLKPSNILISADEHRIKITDFGLTRREDQKWTGELMGTPQFVAPEIVMAGSHVNQSADIFAIGMMMFRMLTGRFPFTGDDQQILYNNVNKDIPPLSHYAPGVNGGISGIISWCTRRIAQDRPENATELYHELKRIAAFLSPQELDYRAPFDDVRLPEYSWWQDVELIASKADPSWKATRPLTAVDEDFTKAQQIVNEREFFAPQTVQSLETVVGPAESKDTDPTVFDMPVTPEPIRAEYRPKPRKQEQATSPEHQHVQEADPRRPQIQLVDPIPFTTVALYGIGFIFALVMAGWVGWWLAQTLMSSDWFQAFMGLF